MGKILLSRSWLAALLVLGKIGAAMAEEQVVRIGTEAADAPFEFKDAAGHLKGAEIDLGNAICARMQVKCVWVDQDFDSLIPALQAHKIDAALSQISVTPERRKSVDFTDLVTAAPAQLVARKDSGITEDPASLKGKTIGVQSGTTHERYVTERLKGIVEVKVYTTQDEAFLDLKNGRIDATLADQDHDWDWLQKDGRPEFEFAGKPLSDPEIFGAGTAIAVRKGDTALLAGLDRAIASLKADGTLQKIYKTYFPLDLQPK